MAVIQPHPRIHKGAMDTVRLISEINKEIQSCKGVGWIYTGPEKNLKKYRFAFAAIPPYRLRLTLLNLGHPMETIVATGEKVMFVSHTKAHSPYTFNKTDPLLENAFSIPIRMSDITRLLSGQIPLPEFKHVYLVSDEDQRTPQKTIDLKKDFGQKKYRIISRDNHPESISYHDGTGTPAYTMTIQPFTRFETALIPANWSITSSTGEHIRVEITSFKANIPIKDNAFRLTLPE